MVLLVETTHTTVALVHSGALLFQCFVGKFKEQRRFQSFIPPLRAGLVLELSQFKCDFICRIPTLLKAKL